MSVLAHLIRWHKSKRKRWIGDDVAFLTSLICVARHKSVETKTENTERLQASDDETSIFIVVLHVYAHSH